MFTFNVWLMLALMFERYRLLCRKLSNTVGYKPRDIYSKIISILIASFLFASLRFFELKVTYSLTDEQYHIEQTTLAIHSYYMLLYRIIGSLLFYSFVPYILIFIFSMKIWSVIIKSNEEHVKMNVSRTNSTESNRILMALSVRFLVSRLPLSMLDIIELLHGTINFFDSTLTMLCTHASNFLVVLSCALTFFTFYAFSMKFRNSMKCFFK
jgi:hypothetical protein